MVITKAYADAECMYKLKKKFPCKVNGKLLEPYAILNVREYFASLMTSVYGLGSAGVEDVCKYDKVGCAMIKKELFKPNASYFKKENMDPRVRI